MVLSEMICAKVFQHFPRIYNCSHPFCFSNNTFKFTVNPMRQLGIVQVRKGYIFFLGGVVPVVVVEAQCTQNP